MHGTATEPSPTSRVSRRAAGAPGWVAPAAVGVGALAACTLVALHDPNVEGSYGYCPFKVLTGLDCPGCGLLRGTHALLRGHPGVALDHNVLLPIVLGLMVVGYVRWFARSLGRDVPRRQPPSWLVGATVAVVSLFWVLRDLGGPFEYLASTVR